MHCKPFSWNLECLLCHSGALKLVYKIIFNLWFIWNITIELNFICKNVFRKKNSLASILRWQEHFSSTVQWKWRPSFSLTMYLVGGSRIRGVHQEEIMSCIYNHNKCTDRMKINNFLWETARCFPNTASLESGSSLYIPHWWVGGSRNFVHVLLVVL